MKETFTHSELLTGAQGAQVERLLRHTEIMPFSCVFWRLDAATFCRPERVLPDDLIHVPVSGEIEYWIGEHRRVIGPGQLALIPAETRFGHRLAEGSEVVEAYALHLHAVDDRHWSIFGSLKNPFGVISPPESWIRRLAVCTHLLVQRPETGREYARQLVRDILVEQVVSGSGMKETGRRMDPRITNAHTEIRLHFSHDIRIADLARKACIGPARFRQLFKEAFGTSPKVHLQKVRLTNARALLKTQPELTVQEVAYRVGFNDPHNFHKLYRETYGETPRGTQRGEADNYGTTEQRKTEDGKRKKTEGCGETQRRKNR